MELFPMSTSARDFGTYHSSADPESFFRGGQTLTTFFCLFICFVFLVDDGRKYPKPHYKRAIIGPPAKRHLNGVSLAGGLMPNIEC